VLFSSLKTNAERIVKPPRRRNALWMPLINSAAVEWNRSGMNNAAASDATATPKLTDICCVVLAIELAALAWWSMITA